MGLERITAVVQEQAAIMILTCFFRSSALLKNYPQTVRKKPENDVSSESLLITAAPLHF